MGAALRKNLIDENETRGWRGPHDPPGSFFRPEQTYELYKYWPRALTSEELAEITTALSLNLGAAVETTQSPLKAQLVTPDFKPEKYDALTVAVMICQGIDWLKDAENRRGYSDDEMRIYFERIEKTATALNGSLPAPSLMNRLRKFLGDK